MSSEFADVFADSATPVTVLTHGQSASYAAPAGSSQADVPSCSVMLARSPGLVIAEEIGEQERALGKVSVRVSEVTLVERSGRFTIGGDVWTVIDLPTKDVGLWTANVEQTTRGAVGVRRGGR